MTEIQTPLEIYQIDPWLKDFKGDLDYRNRRYHEIRRTLLNGGSLTDFANAHKYYGFHRENGGWVYREWAPAAEALYLIGDFNKWDRSSHLLERIDFNTWEIKLPADALKHEDLVKVRVLSRGQSVDRIPIYIRRAVQDPQTNSFSGQIWDPPAPFEWSDQDYRGLNGEAPFIYETHVGMAQEKRGIGTYREFADTILDRIVDQGYNTVQIMAIMQHPYYASFGYHVSSFFAASSWFGTPEDLKYLVNKAHGKGIAVLMDIVHSHAVKNTAEGINEFDGTDHQFFHSGSRGNHDQWDSKVFNYGKHEVIHFLLSNVKYWMEEFHFDGFRFDGVTSMLYLDHGMGTDFDSYSKYFSMNTDVEAITYLQLASSLVKEINPQAIAIAEDMSGMPGMCLPIDKGGIGFDYRLSMGMPDYWIRTLKKSDDHWDMHEMYHELSTTRPSEKRIGYVESHDQALVGDKTVIFRMADKEMYTDMNKFGENLIIDRAIALSKMIRFATIAMGSDGYLNFMGNEFGHPEWIDFPREGNNWSFEHCRRQWSLAEKDYLRYKGLNEFDKAMIHFMKENDLMGTEHPEVLWRDNGRKVIAIRKKGRLFLFNFHPTESYEGFELPTHDQGAYRVVLDTDEQRFGGMGGRISHDYEYPVFPMKMDPEYQGITLYCPSRTAMVLEKIR
ncbi:MAG: alpha amylase C-terminal domain-containing protein [Tissierellia bacterium]|nr:alpha amylase C-terminal domain-containing protein [Tissierellia bacterium]